MEEEEKKRKKKEKEDFAFRFQVPFHVSDGFGQTRLSGGYGFVGPSKMFCEWRICMTIHEYVIPGS